MKKNIKKCFANIKKKYWYLTPFFFGRYETRPNADINRLQLADLLGVNTVLIIKKYFNP